MHNILVTGSNGQLGNEFRLVVEEKDKINPLLSDSDYLFVFSEDFYA